MGTKRMLNKWKQFFNKKEEKRKVLVCFGDSITSKTTNKDGTKRLTPRIEAAFPSWIVVNSGISGNTTVDAKGRLDEDVLKYKPDFVTILFGANDTAKHKLVSIEEYEHNLRFFISEIGPRKIVLISPAPVVESLQQTRTNAVIREYANVVEKLSNEIGVSFIPLFEQMIKFPDYQQMLVEDGLHFNHKGYEFLAELIIEMLHKK
jgi:lysophospholipase L1-like esterase